MRFIALRVVARGGIEPPTRGFSVRRRARVGASKPKTGNAFSGGRPNRPARPTYPEPEPGEPAHDPRPDPVQRLARLATEPSPNGSPIGARRARASSHAPSTAPGRPAGTTPRSERWEPEILRAWCCGTLSSGLLNFRFSPPLLPSPMPRLLASLSLTKTKSRTRSYLSHGSELEARRRTHPQGVRHPAVGAARCCRRVRASHAGASLSRKSVGARSGEFPDDLPSDRLQHAQSLR